MKKEKKNKEYRATHEEICNQALEHYEKISKEADEWNSVVPKAIRFYRDKEQRKKETLEIVFHEIESLKNYISKEPGWRDISDIELQAYKQGAEDYLESLENNINYALASKK